MVNKTSSMTDFIGRGAVIIACRETCLQLVLCQKSVNFKINLKKTVPKTRKEKKEKLNQSFNENNKLDYIKFSEDLQYIENIFHLFLQQLTQDGSSEINVESLTTSIEVLNNKSFDTLNNLKLKVKRLQNTLQDLEQEKEKEITKDEHQLEKSSRDIINVRHQILTGLWTHNLEMKMLKRWKSNRLEMLEIVHEKQHQALMNTLLAIKRHINEEERFIKFISSFRYDQVFLLERQLNLAKNQFEEKHANALDRINITKKLIKEQNQFFEEKRCIYREYQNLIDEFDQYKEEAKRLIKYERYRNKCVTRIQAWWRGVMVRRGLGKYRKKSKKSKGKGKGNKKK